MALERGSRASTFLVGGLIFTCLFLACSWWSLSSHNFQLVQQMSDLEQQLKISTDELEKCIGHKRSLEEKLESLQSNSAALRVKLDQLKSDKEDLQSSLVKIEEEKNAHKKYSNTLQSNITLLNTELDSWRKLAESRNTALEALRTEKTALTTKLADENTKVADLTAQIKDLKEKQMVVVKGPASLNDDNTAAENKADANNIGDSKDAREMEMGPGQ